MDCSITEKREYFDILYRTVVREALDYDGNSEFTIEEVSVLFSFDSQRHAPETARYWKERNHLCFKVLESM